MSNGYGALLSRAGAVGLNASTSHDATKFYISLPANKLELWFALEAERFQVCIPLFQPPSPHIAIHLVPLACRPAAGGQRAQICLCILRHPADVRMSPLSGVHFNLFIHLQRCICPVQSNCESKVGERSLPPWIAVPVFGAARCP